LVSEVHVFQKVLRALCAGAYALFLAVVSIVPASGAPFIIPLPHADKAFHAAGYAVLFLLSRWGFPAAAGGDVGWRRDIIRGSACVLYGMALEIAQGILPFGREFSLADAAANAAGVLLALAATRFRRGLRLPSSERC
jgi:VanZ family protein